MDKNQKLESFDRYSLLGVKPEALMIGPQRSVSALTKAWNSAALISRGSSSKVRMRSRISGVRMAFTTTSLT